MVADAAFEAVDIDNNGSLDKEGEVLLRLESVLKLAKLTFLHRTHTNHANSGI